MEALRRGEAAWGRQVLSPARRWVAWDPFPPHHESIASSPRRAPVGPSLRSATRGQREPSAGVGE